MGGLQPDMEPLGVRRSERPADHTHQTVETGRTHVQQVSAIVSVGLAISISILVEYEEKYMENTHIFVCMRNNVNIRKGWMCISVLQ